MPNLYWNYGYADSGEFMEGDPVEVTIVDLGYKANAEIANLYDKPTNLSEIGF